VVLMGCGVALPLNVRLDEKTDPVAPLPSSQPDRMTQNVIGRPPLRAEPITLESWNRAGKIRVGRDNPISR